MPLSTWMLYILFLCNRYRTNLPNFSEHLNIIWKHVNQNDLTSGYATWVTAGGAIREPQTPKNTSFLGVTHPQGSHSPYILGDTTRPRHTTCPSLIEIGSKTAEKNSAQTNKQTNQQTLRLAATLRWFTAGGAIRIALRQLLQNRKRHHWWRHNLCSRWKLQKMAWENFSIGAFYNITKNQNNPMKTVGRDSFFEPQNP